MENRIKYLVEYLNDCTTSYDEGNPLIIRSGINYILNW